MSTKTIFKHIALVAVAALGIGALSSVSSATAAVTPTNSLVITSSMTAATMSATPATGAADFVADLNVAIAAAPMASGGKDAITTQITARNGKLFSL